jgi:hypothetical protein
MNTTMPETTTSGPDGSVKESASRTPEHELIIPKRELRTAYLRRL